MIYRDFKGEKLSALGLGTMRMPVVDGKEESIDEEKAREMVDFAMKNGINYYDTAWMYHGGNSERMIGKILADYPRGSFNLATKFPGNIRENISRVEEIFEEQLRRCRVGYFDFYLFHNVCEINVDNYMDPQYGVMEYLLKQKKEGRIRHLGFSTHGRVDVMRRFMDAYGKDLEFCQIQLNYLDYKFQHAKEKVELIKQYGLPVWVMEPLRGGKLATVDDKYAAELTALRPDESVPGWGFRFLQSIPEVTMVLSGMSNLQQLADNIRIFSEDKPLDSHELTALTGIADKMIGETALPCTGCLRRKANRRQEGMNKGLSRRRIVLNGQDIEYELQRKQVKNINLRIRQDGTVYVSASPTVSLTVIEKFMQSRSGLILSAIEGAKLAQRPLNDPAGDSITVLGRELPVTVIQGAGEGVEQKNGRLYVTLKDISDGDKRRQLVQKYLDGLCGEVFSEVLDRMYPLIRGWGVKKPEIKLRTMSSRWGSCAYTKGRITINKRLIAYPIAAAEMVTLHELCHFVHPDHSKDFYALLQKLMPDWKARKKLLSSK